MTIQPIHDEIISIDGKNVDERIHFKSTGWWGDGPIAFRCKRDVWSVSTNSGGQTGADVDVLERIREMREMLDYAEKVIVQQRFKEAA
jgi:hypothetical protein